MTERVCLSVCLSLTNLQKHISELHQIFCASGLLTWLGPAVTALLECYVRTSGFVDDVMFSHNIGQAYDLSCAFLSGVRLA